MVRMLLDFSCSISVLIFYLGVVGEGIFLEGHDLRVVFFRRFGFLTHGSLTAL